MIAINIEDFKLRFPNNSKIILDDMNKDAQDFYLSIYALYMDLFNQYIIKNTHIKDYDDIVSNDDLGYQVVADENKDIYQQFSDNFLQYFYIRNNLYLERLSNDDINLLKEKIIDENFELDEATEELVSRTFRSVIFENINGDVEHTFLTNFGPEDRKFFAYNHSLVIGVRFLMDYDDLENYFTLENNLVELCQKVENSLMESLNMDVKVIQYNDYSIKKKLDNDILKK